MHHPTALTIALLALTSPTALHAQDVTQDDAPAFAPLSEQEARALADELDHADTRVVHPGEDPLLERTLTPLVGYTVTTVATQFLSVERTFDGVPMQTAQLPTHTARITSAITDVTPDNAPTVTSTVEALDVDEDSDASDNAKATIRSLLEPLVGIQAERRITARGLPTADDNIRTDPTDNRDLAQRVAQMALLPVLILPDEPIGVGAVWHARRDFTEDTAKQTLIYTYTLTDASDDELTVRVHGRYLLDEQRLPANPRMPEMITTILQGSGTLIGEMTFDRRAAAPTSAFLRTDAALRMEGKSPQSSASVIDQRLFSEITIQPAKTDP